MTYVELRYGLKLIKNTQLATKLIDSFHMILPTKSQAKLLAQLKWSLDRKGTAVSMSDLFIASQVIDENLVLVTKDTDFERISELNCVII